MSEIPPVESKPPPGGEKTLQDWVKYLGEMRGFYHRGLWEEEKHYTWLASAVLGAIVLLVGKVKDISITTAYGGTAILALLGLGVSAIAFHVISLESMYFQPALHRVMLFEEQFISRHYPDARLLGVPPFEIPKPTRRSILKALLYTRKLNIRQAFLLTFMLFEITFAVIFVSACLVLVF